MRRIVALVVGAALLALPACGQKTNEANRAAGITPKDALAFFDANLSPSIEQKRNLLSIARQFPSARDKVQGQFDDARDRLLAEALQGSGLDYEKDVKPWLGDEVAVAILPAAASKTPLFVAMVQADDEAKAKAAIAKATKSGDFGGAYAVVEGFVVVSDQEDPAQNQPVLDRVTAAAKASDGGLASTKSFTTLVDQLHGDRLLLGWVDTKQVLDEAGGAGPLSGLNVLGPFTKTAGATALDLHAEDKAAVVEAVTTAGPQGTTSDLAITRALPASTLAALTLVGLDKTLAGILSALSNDAGRFTAGLGIDVQQDVLSWMGGEAVLVAGPVRAGAHYPDFGLVIQTTDQKKAEAGVAKLRERAAALGVSIEERQMAGGTVYAATVPFEGFEPALGVFPGRVVLASSGAFLEQLAKPANPDLGGTKAYENAVGKDQAGTTMQLVVLIDPLREAFESSLLTDPADRARYEKDVKPNLVPLDALGVRARRDGSYDRIEARLTFD